MRIPNPKAVTTTEAYLAYKAEVLEQSELKDKLYHPYLHIDGWLAYWTGLTATYPTDKNGDPECLTDEEAYISYLSGVTSEYPEALKDPADVRVASYLRYLISARFGRPDYPVTREEFYLSMMKPAFIPSGDPSSSIEIDGTVEAPFVDVKMYGDTFQQTYSGKNLFNVFDKLSSSNLTVDSEGWMTCTIDNTSGSSTVYGTYFTNSIAALQTSTTYAIVMEVKSVSGTGTVYPTQGSSSLSQFTSNIPVNFGTVTAGGVYVYTQSTKPSFSGTTISLRNAVSFAAGQSGSITFRMSILADTTITPSTFSYEPYVGGTASPNPDYPQDIDVVTGRQAVGVSGKNLLPSTGLTNIEYNGVAFTPTYDDDGRLLFITLNGVATGGAAFTIGYMGFKGGETYTASGLTSGSNSTYRVWFDSSYAFPAGNRLFILDGDRTATALEDETNVRAYVQIFPGAVLDDVVVYPQVELGSASTNYEPYQSQSYTVDLGTTELCKIGNYQDYIYKSGDDWYVHKETGKIVLAGGSDETWGRASVTGGKYRFFVDVSGIQTTSDTSKVGLVISDKLVEETNESQFAGNQGIRVRSNDSEQLILYINATSTMDVDSFKTWLASNNITAYYALSTPTDTKITDNTLIGELNALMEGGSYEGKTYITVEATDPNLPGLLYVEAAV